MTALAKVDPPQQQRSVLTEVAHKFGMEPAPFEATLRATVCKGNISREELAAGLVVCRAHNLNPLLKEIYFFPAKGGGVIPVVSVDGWSRIINDHPAFDGMEFVDEREDGQLVAITCKMFRKDRSRPIAATEYMAECRMDKDVWRKWPARMLRHKSMIQAARYAFGFSGIVDQDEYERIVSVENVPLAGTGMRERYEARAREVEAPNGGFNADFVDAELDSARADDATAFDPETGEIVEDAHWDNGAAPGSHLSGDPVDDLPPASDKAPTPASVVWVEVLTKQIADGLFKTVADVDAFIADPDNARYFKELQVADPGAARKLNAQLKGQRKALADRELAT